MPSDRQFLNGRGEHSEILISLSGILETPVSILLGETIMEASPTNLKAISEKLEDINLQLTRKRMMQRKAFHGLFIMLCVFVLILLVVLAIIQSPYLGWDFSDSETAVVATAFHAFEWLFVRLAPIILISAVIVTGRQH